MSVGRHRALDAVRRAVMFLVPEAGKLIRIRSMKSPIAFPCLWLIAMMLLGWTGRVVSEEGTFWTGHRLSNMKEYKVENWMNVRTASMLARRYRPSPAYTVLLRSDRFYVLDDSVKVRTVVAQMPVLAGDKFFDIEDLAAAEAMKLPILKGEEAPTCC